VRRSESNGFPAKLRFLCFAQARFRASVNRDRGRTKNGHGMFHHAGSPLSFPKRRSVPSARTRTLPLEPICQQFKALLPEHETDHQLGCHRSRIPEKVVLEKLVRVLVFGCAYHTIADETCSESTLRRRRDEWIELGVMERLRRICLERPTTAPSDRSSRRWPWTAALRRHRRRRGEDGSEPGGP